MKVKAICTLLFVNLLTIGWVLTSSAQMSSLTYRVPAQVLDSGGLRSNSATFKEMGVIGQSTPIGPSQSTGFFIIAGFIPQKLIIKQSRIVGDLDLDGDVDADDLNILMASWNKSAGDPGYNPDADLNNDDIVNYLDRFILSRNWTG